MTLKKIGLTTVAATALAIPLLFSAVGCEVETEPAPSEAIEETGEAVEETGEEVGESVEDAADSVGDAAE